MESFKNFNFNEADVSLTSEDKKLVEQQKKALPYIKNALKLLQGNTSRMGGVDVRDAVKGLKEAQNRIERNVEFASKVFKKS